MSKPIAIVLSCLTLAATAAAQNPRSATYSGVSASAEASAKQDPAEDSVSGTLGVDFTTAYFFRGLKFEDQGFIAQPHLQLDYTLHSGDGAVRSVDLIAGVWNSLHSGPTGVDGGTSAWYESDFFWGFGIGLGQGWSASATYAYYASPNASFATAEEVVLGLAYDDTGLWGDGSSGLQPGITVGIEMKGQQDGGLDRGLYGQLAVQPTFGLGKSAGGDWTLAVPIAIGLSLSDYYEDGTGEDNAFGFVDVGAALSTPLSFVASRFGPWTMTVSVHALLLGDTPEAVNGGDDFELIGSMGLSTAF